jgi:hypothetical protein
MLDRRAIRAAEEMEGYVNYDMYAEQEEQESEEYHE